MNGPLHGSCLGAGCIFLCFCELLGHKIQRHCEPTNLIPFAFLLYYQAFEQIYKGRLFRRDFEPYECQLLLESQMRLIMQTTNLPAEALCGVIISFAFDLRGKYSVLSDNECVTLILFVRQLWACAALCEK